MTTTLPSELWFLIFRFRRELILKDRIQDKQLRFRHVHDELLQKVLPMYDITSLMDGGVAPISMTRFGRWWHGRKYEGYSYDLVWDLCWSKFNLNDDLYLTWHTKYTGDCGIWWPCGVNSKKYIFPLRE